MPADRPKRELSNRESSSDDAPSEDASPHVVPPDDVPDDAPDDVLVAALVQGQTAALAVLYRRYGRLVYTIAYRVLNSQPEAEDLTQEVFLTFWQKQNYNAGRGSVSRFLSTVTRNRAIDRVRSRTIRHRILRGMVPPAPASNSLPVEQASQGERSERVRAALQQISPPQRELLALAYYDGLSQSEIARHTNLPLGTVKSRMRQGLIKLKKLLGDLVDESS